MSFSDLQDFLPKVRRKIVPHYYGDVVRSLFMVAGGAMLIFIPLQGSLLPDAALFFVFAVVLMAIVAGLTNPRGRSVCYCNVAISFLGVLIFEFYAARGYREEGFSFDFLMHQIIALLFFVALYYSTKTLRNMLQGQNRVPPELPPGFR